MPVFEEEDMNKRIIVAVFIGLAALLLANCGAQDVATTASDAGTTVSQTAGQLSKASLGELTAQLPSIETAIDAGNTEEARAAFSAFLGAWDALKTQATAAAPENAAAIQTAMDSVKQTLVDTPTPNAADVKAALAELETQFTNFGNSLK
jgi:hypothetical protein